LSPTEHTPKKPSHRKGPFGLLAVLRNHPGIGAPSARRLALLALTLAFLLVPAAQAFAGTAKVHIAGLGSGEVSSVGGEISGFPAEGSPPIECSGPPASGTCENTPEYFFGVFPIIGLTATAAPGYEFTGWTIELGSAAEGCQGTEAKCGLIAFESDASLEVTASFGCIPPIAPPAATTGGSSPGQDPLTRTLEGTVNPNGCGLEETYFEYGTSTEYGNTTTTKPEAAALGVGSAPVPVTAETDFLEPSTPEHPTTYHYRLVAVGPGGTVRGEDQLFTTGPASTDTCPNALFRAEQGTLVQRLPDCMALEMVSPPQKAGQPAKYPNVSLDGSRVSFVSTAALGENPPPPLGITGSIYVASRSGAGWTTERTLPGVTLDALWATANGEPPTASFIPDFSRGLGMGATRAQQEKGFVQAYDAGLGGSFRWLSAPLEPLTSGEALVQGKETIALSAALQAASADHSHLYFRAGRAGGTTTTYLPHDPSLSGPSAETNNTYLARLGADGQPVPKPELLQRAESGKEPGKVWGGECGARLGGIGAANNVDPAPNGDRNQGAVSADGSRTYFSARAAQPQSGECESQNKLRILQRLETPSGAQISPLFSSSECNRPATPNPPGPCSGEGEVNGDDLYQGASLDQSKVYFTTNRQLVSSDIDGGSEECDLHSEGEPIAVPGCDLYLYNRDRTAGERLIQVSVGEDVPGQHKRGSEADVYNAITAISADGSRAYFVATGVLTNDRNPEEETATEGEPNLYMFDLDTWEAEGEAGGLTFIGVLDSSDGIDLSGGDYSKGLWGGQGTWKNDAYPVPVLSPAEQHGEGDGEEGGDGDVLVFETHASLTPNDADGGHLDVYRYDSDGGTLQCVSCHPGSSAAEWDEEPFDVQERGDFGPLETDFAEHGRWVSESGDEIVFNTAEGLVPGDINGAVDGYLWQSGQHYRLTRGGVSQVLMRGRPVLSPDGSTIAFSNQKPLLPQDGDTADDVYVARAGGGFPRPPAPHLCEPGSDCQSPQIPPAAPAAASESPTSGNRPRRPCRKGKVRRKGHCVAKHKHKAKKHRQTRHTETNRRMGK
jgi:WD40-like Beta Propeller Repeat